MSLIPKLKYIFIYTCNDKYTNNDLIRYRKFIKVDYITGEFIWKGSHNWGRYGQFSLCKNGKVKLYLAHRVAIEMATGVLIPDDKVVMHKYDNPLDVNPDHLKVGTTQDNVDDKVNKGRQPSCETHGQAKLNWIQVDKIRYEYKYENYTIKQLADKYDIHEMTIHPILKNKTWYDPKYIITLSRNGKNGSKLTQKIADDIRQLWLTGKYTMQQLADKFGVGVRNIHHIINNKIWIKSK